MTLFNPIAGFFEWILTVYSYLPFAVKALINLSLAIPLVMALFGILFRVKH